MYTPTDSGGEDFYCCHGSGPSTTFGVVVDEGELPHDLRHLQVFMYGIQLNL